MKTLITAHSGAENTRDNTLESIRILCECGADAIEVDVRRHEGKLVLSHNPVGADERPATLEECFEIVRNHPGLKMNLDLKHGGQAGQIYALAEKCGVTDRLIFTGDVREEDLPIVRRHNIEVCYNDSLVPAGQDPMQRANDLGFSVLNICWRDATEKMLQTPEKLSLWTVNEPELLEKYIALGVYNITTRHPRQAIAIRERLSK